jgi:GTPase involved in cell partitioning and DNA repair
MEVIKKRMLFHAGGAMKQLGRAALLAVLLGAAGCYKATFVRDQNAVKGAEHDRWLDFWFWGLMNEQDVNVRDFCPDGRVAQVVTGGNFGTGIVHFLTLGIYAPRKVYVTCATDGRAMQLELDERGKLVAVAEVTR